MNSFISVDILILIVNMVVYAFEWAKEGYIEILHSEIVERMQFARHFLLYHQAIRLLYDRLTNGGVQLHTLQRAEPLDTPVAIELSRAIELWGWEVLLYGKALGIMPVSLAEDVYRYASDQNVIYHQGRPAYEISDADRDQQGIDELISKVMNVESMRIFFRVNLYNKREYRFMKYMPHLTQQDDSIETEILGIYVIEFDPPTLDSNNDVQLNTVYDRLYPYMSLYGHNILCHKQSSMLMSNPPMTLQENAKKTDPDSPAVVSTLDLAISASSSSSSCLSNGRAMLTDQSVAKTFHPAAWYEQERQLAQMHLYSETTRHQLASLTSSSSSSAQDEPSLTVETATLSAETKVNYLPENYALAKQNMAAAVPYMMEWKQTLEQVVYLVLGIPPGVQFNLNPAMDDSSSTIGKAFTKSKSSSQQSGASTAYDSYLSTIRVLRHKIKYEAQYVLDQRSERFRQGFANRVAQKWQKNRKKKHPYATYLPVSPDLFKLTVELPGLPSWERTTELYRMGAIKYEEYIRVAKLYDDFRDQGFEEKPVLDRKQINGVVDPPPPTATSTASKTKKKKK